ncbi:RNA-binding cell elongation regulator Jag/EloR [Loigolactobacillus zhaoyuanensis]|uniref:RNA-binding cell elongation regulator Jag/EloR n=1 Tax=Loigolactobacillus zhaoyuanensis TaxID=2486017 RepID=UPI000F747496|nr:RNA-binding cell elongation regulator Jag/EloR [Loigolactobacillus zhaoyuanensis]
MATFEGSTIQTAIQKGLTHLNLERDAVNVEVVSEGRKGFLGLGRKPAIVSLTALTVPAKTVLPPVVKPATDTVAAATVEQPQQMTPAHKHDDDQALTAVTAYLTAMATAIDAPASLAVQRASKNRLTIQLTTEKEGLLIGHHGKTINALQYLGQVYLNHHAHSKFVLLLNVGDYRERRNGILARLADKTAREAIATGQATLLEPMPAFERKQIHAHLADSPHVATFSEGDEPHRYVVIAPKPHVG